MNDDEFAMMMLINNIERAEEAADHADIPRLYFQRQNPFEVLSDNNFIKHFRLNKESFMALLDELVPFLHPNQRRSGLDHQTKVYLLINKYRK